MSSPRSKASPANRQTRRFRTGCKTCKARRIQCDETRPECTACVSKGRSCPGYTRDFKWSTKHEVSARHDGRRDRGSSQPGVAPFAQTYRTSTIPGGESEVRVGDGETREDEGNDAIVDASRRQQSPRQHSPALVNGSTPKETRTIGTLDLDSFKASHVDPQSLQLALLERRATELQRRLDSRISPQLTDFPTFLIEYWFKNICCIWSGFDSDRNLNRNLAMSTWTNQKSVFHCLQAMSAFHLAEQLPHLGDTAMTSWKSAVQAIHEDLASVTTTSPTRLPTGLLLSLSGIGTTTCWTDSQQLGLPLLKKMKTLLAHYNRSAALMSSSDRLYLEFFNDSCIYWDILCKVVTDDASPIGPSPALSPSSSSMPETAPPHPWVGVSRNILELFANSILLCKRYCKRLRSSDFKSATVHSLRDMIDGVHEARSLRKTLIGLKQSTGSQLAETGDKLTPLSHLVDVAEGYRLAALLQLYQTFKDLEDEYVSERDGSPDETWIQGLALELLDLMKRIPLESGSRCIQPLLYLSIATGLRSCPPVPVDVPHIADGTECLERHALQGNVTALSDILGQSDLQRSNVSSMKLTRMSVNIGQARRIIMQRVSVLEYSLPTKPITVLKALMKRIWDVWDAEMCGGRTVRSKHWIEVMEESRLHTMFG
ncbi:hypothetical protein BO70DRAFT_338960 [Aspergillus heteromorphus CBS 117.55]|uniref:Zn(2)-C6 fungal-type domain-containing protein n=1 Tax=Aspergillus heteromorphus CBS 117.55 TaxID=1448321 RepID=A0A317VVF4_9EURO|nr:uncharacterized protein BO70DRAFT_338960 [Aspergillus heteromorphus CBS 117.55]PWY78374.1 hypothetical protein BO70DRAFT_338960 [Aspergillus heteromorphus CBS 117.55]